MLDTPPYSLSFHVNLESRQSCASSSSSSSAAAAAAAAAAAITRTKLSFNFDVSTLSTYRSPYVRFNSALLDCLVVFKKQSVHLCTWNSHSTIATCYGAWEINALLLILILLLTNWLLGCTTIVGRSYIWYDSGAVLYLIASFLSITRSTSAKIYQRLGARLTSSFNSLKHFAHLSPNFYSRLRSQKFGLVFWRQWLWCILVSNYATYRKS